MPVYNLGVNASCFHGYMPLCAPIDMVKDAKKVVDGEVVVIAVIN